MVCQFVLSHPPPQVILVHLGENGLGQRTSKALRLQAHRDFITLQGWFPGVVILWSNLLPHRVWHGARSFRIDVTRKRINDNLGRVVASLGGTVIPHLVIRWDCPALFCSDGVHLSSQGYNLLLADWQQGLRSLFLDGERRDKQ